MPIGFCACISFKRRGAGENDGKNILLANTTRNQLRVLRTKVQDNDRGGVHALVFQAYRRL